MYVKNSNFLVYVTLSAIVGFGLSFLLSLLGLEPDFSKGDISKANRYSNQKEDPEMTVIEEKLRNDEEFFNDTKIAMEFLQKRMTALSELTDQTIAACEGIPEFESLIIEMKSLNAKSFNTAEAISIANSGLDRLAEGNGAPEYELYSNQAYVGFLNVESHMGFGRNFHQTATAFLNGKESSEYKQIADLADVWAAYCAQDAQFNPVGNDLAYWSEQYLSQDSSFEKDFTSEKGRNAIMDNQKVILLSERILRKLEGTDELAGVVLFTDINPMEQFRNVVETGQIVRNAFPFGEMRDYNGPVLLRNHR